MSKWVFDKVSGGKAHIETADGDGVWHFSPDQISEQIKHAEEHGKTGRLPALRQAESAFRPR